MTTQESRDRSQALVWTIPGRHREFVLLLLFVQRPHISRREGAAGRWINMYLRAQTELRGGSFRAHREFALSGLVFAQMWPVPAPAAGE